MNTKRGWIKWERHGVISWGSNRTAIASQQGSVGTSQARKALAKRVLKLKTELSTSCNFLVTRKNYKLNRVLIHSCWEGKCVLHECGRVIQYLLLSNFFATGVYYVYALPYSYKNVMKRRKGKSYKNNYLLIFLSTHLSIRVD